MRWLGFSVVVLAACSSPDLSLILRDAPEIDRLILVGERSGSLASLRLVSLADAPNAVLVSGQRLTAFAFASKDVLESDGSPLSEDALNALTLGPSTDALAPGSCGRCLAPGAAPPLLLPPGSACPAPRFARVWESDRLGIDPLAQVDPTSAPVAQTRSLFRVLRPGECTFPFSELPPPGDPPVIEPLFPAIDAVGIDSAAQRPDGSAILFTPGRVIEIGAAPEAPRTVREVPDLARALDAVALPDGSAMIVQRKGPISGALQRYVSGQLLPVAPDDFFALAGSLVLAPPSLAPALDDRPAPNGLVFAAGRRFRGGLLSDQPTLLACAIDRAAECQALASGEFDATEGALISPVLLADGALVAFAVTKFSEAGKVLYGARDGAQWVFLHGSYVPDYVGGAVAIGQRVIICSQRRSWAATATLTAASILAGVEPQWQLIPVAAELGVCSGLVSAGEPDRAWMTSYVERHWELSFSGGAVTATRSTEALFGIPAAYQLRETGPGRYLAMSALGVWRGAALGNGRLGLEQIYGARPATERLPPPLVVAATADGFTVIGQGMRYDVRGSTTSTRYIAGIDGTPVSAVEEGSGTILVSGESFDGEARLWRVQDARAESIALSDAVTRARLKLLRLTAQLPGVELVAGEEWTLWRLAGDELTQVEINWDDPDTPESEQEPELGVGCSFLPGSNPTRDGWRGLDSAGGIAWAVGCGGTIVRIDARASRAERFAISRLEGTSALAPDVLVAVRVFGPDHAVIAANGSDQLTRSGRFLELRPAGERLALRELPSPDLGPGFLTAIVGDISAPLVLSTQNSAIRSVGGATAFEVGGIAMQLDFFGFATRNDGSFLISGRGPRLFLGRLPR